MDKRIFNPFLSMTYQIQNLHVSPQFHKTMLEGTQKTERKS